jgi:hypothetical protein
MTPALQALIDGFFTTDSLLEACMAIEIDGMYLRAALTRTQTCLTRRTEALERARAVIEAQRRQLELWEQGKHTPVGTGEPDPRLRDAQAG